MFWFWLAQILIAVVIPIITTILRFLGIGAVTYMGINLAMNKIMSLIQSYLTDTPIFFQALAGLIKLDIVINIYLSALVAKMVLKGIDKATDRKKQFSFKG